MRCWGFVTVSDPRVSALAVLGAVEALALASVRKQVQMDPIETTKSLACFVHKSPAAVDLGEITLEGDRGPSFLFHFGTSRTESTSIATVDRHRGAGLGQGQGEDPTDPTRRAGQQNPPICQGK